MSGSFQATRRSWAARLMEPVQLNLLSQVLLARSASFATQTLAAWASDTLRVLSEGHARRGFRGCACGLRIQLRRRLS